MRLASSLLFVASLAFVAMAEEEAVVTLTTATFDDFMKENPLVLAEFYAPWCGHCKSLAPEYEKAAQRLKGKVPLAKIDATVEGDLASKFGVRGYPTLKLFRKGTPQDYEGGRTADTIVEWIENQSGPAVREVDAAGLEELKKEKKVVFAANAAKDSALYKAFEAVADVSRDAAVFAHVSGSENKVTVYRQGEDSVVYTGAAAEDGLKAFVAQESFALFGEINSENYKKYDEREGMDGLAWVTLDLSAGKDKVLAEEAPKFRELAKKHRNYSFVWLDTVEYKEHASGFLGVSKFPAVVVMKGKKKFVWQADKVDGAVIDAWLKDVAAGKVEAHLKSQEVPASQEDVKVVVGKNFDEMVFHADKDVLLEVYAPWCGHCKKLEPAYKELAESLKGQDHIVIAKLDGTENDIGAEGFEWQGFPTIFWVKAGSKTPTQFEGDRTLEGMQKFIKENASKPVEFKAGAKKASGATGDVAEWVKSAPEMMEKVRELVEQNEELKKENKKLKAAVKKLKAQAAEKEAAAAKDEL